MGNYNSILAGYILNHSFPIKGCHILNLPFPFKGEGWDGGIISIIGNISPSP